MKPQQIRLAGTRLATRVVEQGGADCKPPRKNFGVPTQERYDELVEEYIKSLSVRKREKCLISQEMFDDIWDVLHNPSDAKIRTPQFRFWVRKMFTLGCTAKSPLSGDEDDVIQVILHENRPLAVKEQVYDILSYYHVLTGHAGRDRTMAEVKQNYSWVPKELVARFVKICPTCIFKRTGMTTGLPSADSIAEPVSFHGPRGLRPSPSQDSDEGTLSSSYSQAVSLGSSEEGFMVEPVAVSAHHDNAHAVHALVSLMESRILPTPVLSPLLRSPPLGSPNLSADPRKWLADLAMQPGPASVGSSHRFPPLDLRRVQSETGVDPIYAPSSRVTLPPLMKALSENTADYDVYRPRFNVPSAFTIPTRVSGGSILDQDVNMEDPTGGIYFPHQERLDEYSHIDPALLDGLHPVVHEYDRSSYQQNPNMGPPGSYTSRAVPYDLRQSVIFPVDVDYRVPHIQRSGSQDSVSSFASSAGSVHSQGSSASFQPPRRASNASDKNSNSLQQSSSFDAQDWESTYCLEEV